MVLTYNIICFPLCSLPLLSGREGKITQRKGVPGGCEAVSNSKLGGKMRTTDAYAECNHQHHVNKIPAAFLTTPVTGKTTQPFL